MLVLVIFMREEKKKSMVLSLMNRISGIVCLVSLSFSANLVFCGPATAQALDGASAPGQQEHVSAPTGYQSGQDANLVPAAPQGQTWTTAGQTQAFGGMGPNLSSVTSGEMAPNSVNQAPLPSGAFSYGFPGGNVSSTGDPYVPPNLPLTSTGSVDLNTADCDYCGQGVIGPWGW